jgi:hypothetical protein
MQALSLAPRKAGKRRPLELTTYCVVPIWGRWSRTRGKKERKNGRTDTARGVRYDPPGALSRLGRCWGAAQPGAALSFSASRLPPTGTTQHRRSRSRSVLFRNSAFQRPLRNAAPPVTRRGTSSIAVLNRRKGGHQRYRVVFMSARRACRHWVSGVGCLLHFVTLLLAAFFHSSELDHPIPIPFHLAWLRPLVTVALLGWSFPSHFRQRNGVRRISRKHEGPVPSFDLRRSPNILRASYSVQRDP